jgi:hypothetical protein
MAQPRTGRSLRYRRVLVKLSGEALMGSLDYGTDPETVRSIAHQLKAVHDRGVEVALGFERVGSDGAHHLLKLVVAGDKIGLGVDLDQRSLFVVGGEADQTLSRHAARLLGGLGKTFGAQPIDRGLHVAGGLVERGLAIHHARAGLLAQVLHHRCINRCHAILYRAGAGWPRP